MCTAALVLGIAQVCMWARAPPYRVHRYINMYGRYYSVGDAVHMVHLLYGVLSIERLDLQVVCTVATTLNSLLK